MFGQKGSNMSSFRPASIWIACPGFLSQGYFPKGSSMSSSPPKVNLDRLSCLPLPKAICLKGSSMSSSLTRSIWIACHGFLSLRQLATGCTRRALEPCGGERGVTRKLKKRRKHNYLTHCSVREVICFLPKCTFQLQRFSQERCADNDTFRQASGAVWNNTPLIPRFRSESTSHLMHNE